MDIGSAAPRTDTTAAPRPMDIGVRIPFTGPEPQTPRRSSFGSMAGSVSGTFGSYSKTGSFFDRLCYLSYCCWLL